MEPPPAPSVRTSITGIATGSPHSISYSVVNCGSPSRSSPRRSSCRPCQGDRLLEAGFVREVGAADHSAGEPGEQQLHRPLRRLRQPGGAAVRLEQRAGASDAVFAQRGADARTVAAQQRLQVGVGEGGAGALVLAPQRRDAMREGDRDGRKTPFQERAERKLMDRVEIGEQQTHRDRLGTSVGDLRRQSLHRRRFQRRHHLALGVDPLGHLPGNLRRRTSGRGLRQCRSYSLLRLMRWMNGMSSNPAVVTYSTSAPRRCSTVLVATVVPCTMRSMASPASAALSSTRSSAPSGASGVEGALATRTDPSTPSATRSVNVPPVSMPRASGPGDASRNPSGLASSLTSPAVHTRRSTSLQHASREPGVC